ncbi:hypothetical protein BGX28_004511 [Mortierella sp. GBA30]|nr:hypothetical protein BGX28_004511 [Mortierella sp. GBA30]
MPWYLADFIPYQQLKSSLSMLDEVTNGYSRFKTITSMTKKFELVSEQDIASAQADVSKKVEPQLFTLTDKAVEIVLALEAKEYQLMDKVHVEKEKEQQRLQRQKAARSGLSNIKKLQSLTRRKEELTRSALELDEVLDQKREEFNQLVKRANSLDSQSGQQVSVKRHKRNPNNVSWELSRKEEERKREISKRNQELEAIQQKIEDKRKSISDLRAMVDSQQRTSNLSEREDFDPSKPWTMYHKHYNVLETALQTTLKADARDTNVYEEAFARLSAAYAKELDARQARTDKEQDKLMKDHTRTLSQMRNLCKQLFPDESIGLTMVRLLELLASTWENEIDYESLVQVQPYFMCLVDFAWYETALRLTSPVNIFLWHSKNEFPLEEERRHNLSRVIKILKLIGIIEIDTVQRAVEDGNNEEGDPSRTREQVVIRIKYEDNTNGTS